jgi:uncharacterized protein YdeI (YjbR/CyaY-like superfamily)
MQHSGMKIVFVKSQSDFRAWLEAHHDKHSELWVGFYKKDSGKKGITYPEALDEALCFGWIDGVRKSIDEKSYMIRFCPRKARSNWSRVNIKRVAELTELGLMKPPGNHAFERRDRTKDGPYSYERPGKLNEDYEKLIRSNAQAWNFFSTQPPGYRRTITWWVISAKKEETRLRRLATLIEASEKGVRLG